LQSGPRLPHAKDTSNQPTILANSVLRHCDVDRILLVHIVIVPLLYVGPLIIDIIKSTETLTCTGCTFRELPDYGTKAYCTNPDRKSPVAGARCDDYEKD
jgi:hypothetical protein